MANHLGGQGRCPGRMRTPSTRRELLKSSANGFGLIALGSLVKQSSELCAEQPTPKVFTAPARNVIFSLWTEAFHTSIRSTPNQPLHSTKANRGKGIQLENGSRVLGNLIVTVTVDCG